MIDLLRALIDHLRTAFRSINSSVCVRACVRARSNDHGSEQPQFLFGRRCLLHDICLRARRSIHEADTTLWHPSFGCVNQRLPAPYRRLVLSPDLLPDSCHRFTRKPTALAAIDDRFWIRVRSASPLSLSLSRLADDDDRPWRPSTAMATLLLVAPTAVVAAREMRAVVPHAPCVMLRVNGYVCGPVAVRRR